MKRARMPDKQSEGPKGIIVPVCSLFLIPFSISRHNAIPSSISIIVHAHNTMEFSSIPNEDAVKYPAV